MYRLLRVKERWGKGGAEPADDYYIFCGNESDNNHHLRTGFFVHEGTISTIKTVQFVSVRMSYATLWILKLVWNFSSPPSGHFFITNIKLSMLFNKITAICSENHTKRMNTIFCENWELLNVEVSGTYSCCQEVIPEILLFWMGIIKLTACTWTCRWHISWLWWIHSTLSHFF